MHIIIYDIIFETICEKWSILIEQPTKEYKSKNRLDMASKRKNFYLSLLVGYFAILILVVLIFWLFYRVGIFKALGLMGSLEPIDYGP